MPAFAEKESSLLAKLKKSKPQLEELEREEKEKRAKPSAVMSEGSTSLVDFDSVNDTTASLADVFANNTGTGLVAQTDDVEIANKTDYTKFVTKSNAILWEDDYIQVGCKLETRNNLGRLGMFYGNKTSQPFNKFTPIITCPGALAVQLQAQAKPVEPVVAAGTQVQQLINFVCVQEFQKMPIMNIKFTFT